MAESSLIISEASDSSSLDPKTSAPSSVTQSSTSTPQTDPKASGEVPADAITEEQQQTEGEDEDSPRNVVQASSKQGDSPDVTSEAAGNKDPADDKPSKVRIHYDSEEEEGGTWYGRKLVRSIEREMRYRNGSPGRSVSPSRREKAGVRVLQYQQYIGLMEDRVSFLESELQKVKEAATAASATAEDGVTKSEPQAAAPAVDEGAHSGKVEPVLEVCEADYQSFRDAKFAEKHVITLLLEEQEPYNTQRDPESLSATQGRRVSRIRINSKHVLDLMGRELPKDTAPNITDSILIRPFKALCMLEDKIREHFTALGDELSRRGTEEDLETRTENEIVQEGEDSHDASESTTASSDPDGNQEDDTEFLLERENTNDIKSAQAHFGVLLSVMDKQLKPDLERHHLIRKSNPIHVTFDDLWHLFQPGQIVYSKDNNQQAYIVLNVRGGRVLYPPPPDRDTYGEEKADKPAEVNVLYRIDHKRYSKFSLDCVYIDFDGKDFGYVPYVCEIDCFKGEKELSSLPVVPVSLAKPVNDETMEQRLRARGHKFELLTKKPAHRDYKGTSLPDLNEAGQKISREQIDSQVIIDFEHAFLKPDRKPTFAAPVFPEAEDCELPRDIECTCKECTKYSFIRVPIIRAHDDRELDRANRQEFLNSNALKLDDSSNPELSDLQRMLLPNHVYGYVFRNLDWYRLDVDHLNDPGKTTNFDDLVLPPNNKSLVKALVNSRNAGHYPEGQRPDLVRGKGRGVIVLLHGVPGTGKSSTAECVAEDLGCPLFTITCGNIGVTPSEVQANLQDMFYMAHKWNCVMLLDEADVFLQQRDEKDMGRNAVVSVFLRALEYYSGILFLTTNKVGKFDEAFISRIHMSINYPPLDQETTKAIWEVNMKRTRELKPHITFNEQDLLICGQQIWWAQIHRANGIAWNGRQIRNAFQTAVALAEYGALTDGIVPAASNVRSAELTRAHFERVSDVSLEFDDYLRRAHGNRDWFTVTNQAQDRADPRLAKPSIPQQQQTRPNYMLSPETAYGNTNSVSHIPYSSYPVGMSNGAQPGTSMPAQHQPVQYMHAQPSQPYGHNVYEHGVAQQMPPVTQYAPHLPSQNPPSLAPPMNQYMTPESPAKQQPGVMATPHNVQPMQAFQQQQQQPPSSPQPMLGSMPQQQQQQQSQYMARV